MKLHENLCCTAGCVFARKTVWLSAKPGGTLGPCSASTFSVTPTVSASFMSPSAIHRTSETFGSLAKLQPLKIDVSVS